ncbi:hypothetical protein PHAVU_003G148500, partial [Phaseolus vulgaris]
ISEVPLFQSLHNNKKIWVMRKMVYSLKSDYRFFKNNILDANHLKMDGNWMINWKLKVPHYGANDVIQRARQALKDWSVAKRINVNTHIAAKGHNVDAIFHVQMKKTGLGFCIRDDIGSFVEDIELIKCFKMGCTFQLTNAIFMLNCKKMVDRLKHLSLEYSEAIISDYSHILSQFPHFQVKFNKKETNAVAHVLAARPATSNANPYNNNQRNILIFL